MTSLHLIRSLRSALTTLRDAPGDEDATRVARALIAELVALVNDDAYLAFGLARPPSVYVAEDTLAPARAWKDAFAASAPLADTALHDGVIHRGLARIG